MSQSQPLVGVEPPIFVDWDLGFQHPLVRQGSDYWEQCRGNRAMPASENLSLRGVKAFVGDIALIDVHPLAGGDTEYSVRLAGENVRKLFGNVTGRRLDEILPPDGVRRWRTGFDLTLQAKRRLRVHGTIGFEGKTWLSFDSVLGPLGHGETVTALFCVVKYWSREKGIAG